MAHSDADPLFDRELSWLSFNARVLQEAADPTVPLLERLKFLAIYSSNLDEFFRVRVASIRSLLRLGSGSRKKLDFNPAKLLKRIHRTVVEQQQEFGRIFAAEILPALRQQGIVLYDDGYRGLPPSDSLYDTFLNLVFPLLHPQVLNGGEQAPFLRNRGLYLVAELWPLEEGTSVTSLEPQYGLVEIPSAEVPRFLVLESDEEANEVVFLDDVIREHMDLLFPGYDVGHAYSIKMTRDAELYIDEDEFEGSLVAAIEKSLSKRETGAPTRLLFDPRTPYPMISYLKDALDLDEDDLIVGGVYHNFSDFFDFPDFGRDDLKYSPQEPHAHPVLQHCDDLWGAVAQSDHLIQVPYQSFDPVVRLFEQAAVDERAAEIHVTLYRVSQSSQIVEALIHAAENGKRVTAFVEVKARFDEAPNIEWARRMEEAGVRVLYSRPKIKVHAKIALVVPHDDRQPMLSYLGTGNFNEKTARVYSDLGLFTCDPRLTLEVRKVFDMLESPADVPSFEHLLVAPHFLRKGLTRFVRREAEHAASGRPAGIRLKLNSLEDPKMIGRLYRASKKGVGIDLIIRGICRAVPGVKKLSENIRATSIVDRYLEHARIYRFENGGDPCYYLASADWMRRNLDHRVEVAFPIYDPRLQQVLDGILALQLNDSVRARVIDDTQSNRRVDSESGVRAQLASYESLASD